MTATVTATPSPRAAINGEVLMALLKSVVERLDRIEHRLSLSVEKESYTVEEAAERVGRSAWTVRQWCNKGQVKGVYKVRGKGRTGEWRLPHEELVRLQNKGPLAEGAHQAA